MKRYTTLWALLVALLVLPTPVGAQDEGDPERWRGELGFALNSAGGNEDLTVITSHIGLTHLETTSYEANIGGRFRYGRSQGEEVAQNVRGDISLDMWPEAGWSPFLFATAENDPFKRLDVRLNSGSGVKRTFWQDDWNEVSLSGAVLYSYENLDVEDENGELTQESVNQTARWSWRGRARRQFGADRRFEQLIYFQPAWDRIGDYLIEAQTSAHWRLIQGLAFNATLRYDRDSTPAPDVGPDDWSVAVGLTISTRW